MCRVFVFSYRDCLGPVGGGRGVTYKLYLANRKYKRIENTTYVFKDCSFSDNDTPVLDNKKGAKQSTYKKQMSKAINSGGIVTILKTEFKLAKAKKWIRETDQRYRFRDEDVFLFQDFESAYAFLSLYNFKNTSLIYHQQGSLYNEWFSFTGVKFEKYRKYLNKRFSWVVENVGVLGFPSYGAMSCLTESEPDLMECISNKKEVSILYNGFSADDEDLKMSESVKDAIEKVRAFSGMKFATVSALNEAKGVERIPEYLSVVKKQYGDLIWILIGNGIKSNEVKENIKRFGLQDNVIWIDVAVPHDDILSVFQSTDFYIMFHRYSIFDYATIEAMAYGNIPILSCVGGNKEVIVNDNGCFVTDFADVSELHDLLSRNTVSELKNRNRQLQLERFSEKAFLEYYYKMIEEKFISRREN